jgi:hypothetical protein
MFPRALDREEGDDAAAGQRDREEHDRRVDDGGDRLTTKPRVAGHCSRAGGLACGGSFGFVEQSCCANARAPVSETRSCRDDVR